MIRISSVLNARCPKCHKGKVLKGIIAIKDRCPECGLNLHPEPGFYLGAMVGFFFTAASTIPPMIALKVMGVDVRVLVVFPLIEFLFVGSFILYYCRILWLHLEYETTRRLEGRDRER